MIVVSQNVFDSLFNSHISDYVESWIYVMGVGIAAGIVSRRRTLPIAFGEHHESTIRRS